MNLPNDELEIRMVRQIILRVFVASNPNQSLAFFEPPLNKFGLVTRLPPRLAQNFTLCAEKMNHREQTVTLTEAKLNQGNLFPSNIELLVYLLATLVISPLALAHHEIKGRKTGD